jgi:hypothetical protein
MAAANTILDELLENAFRRLSSVEKRNMETRQPNYYYLKNAIRNFGYRFRRDTWAVIFVSFSPSDDQRLIVVPISWLRIIRGHYLMVCVPSMGHHVPESEHETPLSPCLNWHIRPVVFCPEGSVLYETLDRASWKRARL